MNFIAFHYLCAPLWPVSQTQHPNPNVLLIPRWVPTAPRCCWSLAGSSSSHPLSSIPLAGALFPTPARITNAQKNKEALAAKTKLQWLIVTSCALWSGQMDKESLWPSKATGGLSNSVSSQDRFPQPLCWASHPRSHKIPTSIQETHPIYWQKYW